ncbi:MAG: succinate dehydrogenase, hydrophobic membrane anchor protein [Rhodospirillales bacterium]|nr:MAG: succinate dehydrogenase, hydrophobic membrane anchor protein [Rhodospirillales bacterium]TVS00199.1 MAG: succinate dehydrogenase, hydrophobic membrane anchor protein [Rhodospirillales bacterium]
MELRSSLSRARGLGSAKEGVHHWWGQRVTAIALVPLSLWFVVSAIGLMGADLPAFQAWIGSLFNAVLMVVLVAVLFYHAWLGMQVVIEDYVHGEAAKTTSLLIVKFALAVMAVACILAVARLAIGA